ncbi:MAG: hypothetical protein ACI9SJ_002047 [Flavobacteriaceae bacterium]|jgi:hypothetical protein
MKNIQFLFILLFVSILSLNAAEDWGATGHRVTGQIAENHLSNKAKKTINKLLKGESLAFLSTYGDEIKSDDKYREYYTWHYVNFPFESTYDEHPKSPKGDLIVGIKKCIDILKNVNSTQEEKIFHLKMLVHFIGDLHQPLHVGIAADKGGNKLQVQWFNDGTNLHSVWDTKMIESYNMSYSELASNVRKLNKHQIKELQKGTPIDWMYESRALCEEIYSNVKVGENLRYKYSYDYMGTVRSQLQKGGIRLASVLNEIFG